MDSIRIGESPDVAIDRCVTSSLIKTSKNCINFTVERSDYKNVTQLPFDVPFGSRNSN